MEVKPKWDSTKIVTLYKKKKIRKKQKKERKRKKVIQK